VLSDPSARFDLALNEHKASPAHAFFDRAHERAVHYNAMMDGLLALLVGLFVNPDLSGRHAKDGLGHTAFHDPGRRIASSAAHQNCDVNSTGGHLSFSFRYSKTSPRATAADGPDDWVAKRVHRAARRGLVRDAARGVHHAIGRRSVRVGFLLLRLCDVAGLSLWRDGNSSAVGQSLQSRTQWPAFVIDRHRRLGVVRPMRGAHVARIV